jgi:hypothetical protein
LETQIQQIATALPHQSNGDPSQSPVQESVKSIFTLLKGMALKSTGGSLGGVDPGNAMSPDKEASAVENFSAKSTQRVKVPHQLRQVLELHRQPKSLGLEMVMFTDLKYDALAGRINR